MFKMKVWSSRIAVQHMVCFDDRQVDEVKVS